VVEYDVLCQLVSLRGVDELHAVGQRVDEVAALQLGRRCLELRLQRETDMPLLLSL